MCNIITPITIYIQRRDFMIGVIGAANSMRKRRISDQVGISERAKAASSGNSSAANSLNLRETSKRSGARQTQEVDDSLRDFNDEYPRVFDATKPLMKQDDDDIKL